MKSAIVNNMEFLTNAIDTMLSMPTPSYEAQSNPSFVSTFQAFQILNAIFMQLDQLFYLMRNMKDPKTESKSENVDNLSELSQITVLIQNWAHKLFSFITQLLQHYIQFPFYENDSPSEKAGKESGDIIKYDFTTFINKIVPQCIKKMESVQSEW